MPKKQTVLVTGGAGFIGSHLVDRLVDNGYAVRVLDNLSTGKLSNIQEHIKSGNVDFIEGDIKDPEIVRDSVKGVDAVAHLAAVVSVPFSVTNPKITFETNVDGTHNLLKALAEERMGKFLFISSCAVYGEPEYLPVDENHSTSPVSPYAESKLLAEKVCLDYQKKKLLKTTVFRLFNVYGLRQGLNEYSGVITKFIDQVEQESPLTIYGDGSQTRDFVHVSSVVEAALQALDSPMAEGEIFNVGTGKPVSIQELAETILTLTGSELPIIHKKARAGDIKQSYANIVKAAELLDYNPQVTLKDGLHALTAQIQPFISEQVEINTL